MDRRRKIHFILFVLYCSAMLWLLLFHREISQRPMTYPQLLLHKLNLEPLRTIGNYLKVIRNGNMDYYRIAVVNLTGNIVLFIPLGYFLPELFPRLRRFPKTLGVIALAILTVELVQLFSLRGTCDVDDLILNIPSAMLGYWLWRLLNSPKKEESP